VLIMLVEDGFLCTFLWTAPDLVFGFLTSFDFLVSLATLIASRFASASARISALNGHFLGTLIIFSDCDMDKAVRQSLSAVFFNKGENCIAAGRLFIEENIHDQFVKRVIEETAKMVIGDPLDRGTHHGPQNHRAHFEKLLEYIETTKKEGAKLVYGGKRVDRPGLFLEPTIFIDVTDDMFAAKEESFGPIMIISKFASDDVDGVLRRANATEYGLASGVFTKDISKALYVSEKLEAGTVFVNTYNKTDVAAPFGGFKQSGFGKDLGEEALNEYLKTKCITVEY